MITLRRLLASVPDHNPGDITCPDVPVRGITCDSRSVEPGFVFVALRGEKVDGHRFVAEAVSRGCLAVVVEDEEMVPAGAPGIRVADSHRAYGIMAAEYFGRPAERMKIVGITGTNGKTTTSWMVEQLVKIGGGRPGVIGTVNYRYQVKGGKTVEFPAPLTTPEPMLLQGLLREMNDAGVTHVILEVSSHSLAQHRLAGMRFEVAVFTNLSRDHLDYHATMENYFMAKQKLFEDYLKPDGVAVIGIEEDKKGKTAAGDWGSVLSERLAGKGFTPFPGKVGERTFLTCGFGKKMSIRADKVRQDIDGLSCTVSVPGHNLQVQSRLIGLHNIRNMMTAAGVGVALGIDRERIRMALETVDRIPGRLERVALPRGSENAKGPRVFVDYAHTPDALANVLQTLKPVTPGLLYCVFGCGGERDRGKRPIMGSVAASLADRVLLTSDNPRGEDPREILAEVEQGIAEAGFWRVALDDLFAMPESKKGYTVLEDRREAIHQVCGRAGRDDVILVAGKGHETYQITVAGKGFFDDRIEVKNGFLRWTADHLVAATGGFLEQEGKSGLLVAISTDTRSLEPGDVFVALRGENFDGHEYVGMAVNKGARAVVVESMPDIPAKDVAIVRVPDTLQALGDLAHYRRTLLAPEVMVVGITGSTGKTTVKEMTASIFDAAYAGVPGRPVLKTQGNLNNLVGLPLSLLGIDAGHRVAVMEMGMNRPGEIARLTEIAVPDVGCITNVQPAHLEGLGSIEGVARAKGELFAEMPGQGIRVVNYDDPQVRRLGGEYGDNIVGFAVTPVGRRSDPAVRATRVVSLGEHGMRFTLHVRAWRKRFSVPATGMHNVANCVAAAAIATAAGIGPESIVRGLMRYSSGDKRLQIVELTRGVRVVNDSYNANPASMAAALRTVRGFGGECRRVALLGDMFELGSGALRAHEGIGTLVGELGFDYLGVTGEFAPTVAEKAGEAGMDRKRIKVFPDKDKMADWTAGLVAGKMIGEGDWILVKGSRGMRMEQVLQSLMQRLTARN